MKKSLFLLAILFVSAVSFAQKDKELILNEDTNLIEATYFHENGEISQQGTFNLAGKLHGEWLSFNDEGKKISVGSYDNGQKVGNWVFWSNDVLKEVNYDNNAIAGVVKTKNSTGIVSKDP
ncbi:MAG: nicotinic acid mononucleotide adenyltransferase [Maribacter sp.]|nr:nicotinic acid mononucleotide adenyltransferase [Maribacter sp.]